MKRNKKYIFVQTLLMLLLTVALTAGVQTPVGAAQADAGSGTMVNPVYLQYQTVYLPYANPEKVIKNGGWWSFEFQEIAPRVAFTFKVRNGNYIDKSTVRSSNENVFLIDNPQNNDWDSIISENFEPAKDDANCHLAGISGYVYYPGTADISFQDKYGQEYVVNLVALPYENPLKSVKITNVNRGRNLAYKLDKFKRYIPKNSYLEFSKNAAKPTVKLRAADGWKITQYEIHCESHSDAKWQSVQWDGAGVKAKTVRLKKVCKGDLIEVYVTLRNDKTRVKQRVSLGEFDPY